MSAINARSCAYCFLDLDVDSHRSRLGLAAAFVEATDSRYGLSSKDLRRLGGSEISRLEELASNDHEWAHKSDVLGGICVRPPDAGNRVVLRMFWDVAPLACENFAALCANGGTSLEGSRSGGVGKAKCKPRQAPVGECGKPLTYRGSRIHRVVPGFVVQGGDFVFGNGSGGESIYGGKRFKDERAGLALKHDRRGVLSMGNGGKNSNTSQFFLTFGKAAQCDGKHVVFGEVISGFEVLDAVEEVGTSGGEPSVPVRITDCGVHRPLTDPGAGYWYDQPDADTFTGSSSTFVVRPRLVVVAPTVAACDRFRKSLGTRAAVMTIAAEDKGAPARVSELLEKFSIDAVVVAPACKELMGSVVLPQSWEQAVKGEIMERRVMRDEVIIIAKPVEALSAVWKKSWIGRQIAWQIDGRFS